MHLLGELEARARELLDVAHYDYFAGGAGDEQTIAENAAAWRKLWIRPRVMVDVSAVDTSTHAARPAARAARAARADGRPAAAAPRRRAWRRARAAGAAGTVYCLSTRATADLAEVAAAASGPLWFQLYVDRDRERTEQVLARVAEHGFEAVLLTVDLPVGGRRERERRHLDVPFPDGVALASHLGHDLERRHSAIGGWDAALTWHDVAWIRDASGLPVIVKGILCAEDADAALDAGADAIVVSNHGGRQVDGCVPTAVALGEVAAAVAGRVPVLVDGGIRDGADVLRALALGADAVLVGRPYAWGLATGGEAGVRAVLDAFAEDFARALALAGCPTVAAVDGRRVRPSGW